MRRVPPEILGPDYAVSGEPSSSMAPGITIKSSKDIDAMRVASALAGAARDHAISLVAEDVTTEVAGRKSRESTTTHLPVGDNPDGFRWSPARRKSTCRPMSSSWRRAGTPRL